MSEKEEEEFRSSNICWICEKLINYGNEKNKKSLSRNCKFRGAAHWS